MNRPFPKPNRFEKFLIKFFKEFYFTSILIISLLLLTVLVNLVVTVPSPTLKWILSIGGAIGIILFVGKHFCDGTYPGEKNE